MKYDNEINNDSFNFWMPVEIEKADNKKDSEDFDPDNMYLKGIASTEDLDMDNQVMLSSGLDLEYFLQRGFCNWHHMSKTIPSAIIGEPVEAKIVSKPVKGLFIKAKLYNSETAIDAYKLAMLLEKQSKTRRLGWSIEGKILEKDGDIIQKSKISGCALTHSPKNANTFADVCKAFTDGSTTDKLINNINNETKYTIETNSGVFNITKDGNLFFTEKALETSSPSGTALRREDLEGAPKKLVPTMSTILRKTLLRYPDISFEKAIEVSELVLKNRQ